MTTIKTKESNPLGILLGLLEKENLDISNFSLAQVADDYLDYLTSFQNQEEILENISDFLWVASKLALIKSRVLISSFDFTEEDLESEETEADLRERLIEYKKFQEISKKIATQFKNNKRLFSRKNQVRVDENISINFTEKDLRRAFRKIVLNFKAENRVVYQRKSFQETIKIEERIEQIKTLLGKTRQLDFSSLITEKSSRIEVVIAFLSVLELVKQGSAQIAQGGCFQEINISKK